MRLLAEAKPAVSTHIAGKSELQTENCGVEYTTYICEMLRSGLIPPNFLCIDSRPAFPDEPLMGDDPPYDWHRNGTVLVIELPPDTTHTALLDIQSHLEKRLRTSGLCWDITSKITISSRYKTVEISFSRIG